MEYEAENHFQRKNTKTQSHQLLFRDHTKSSLLLFDSKDVGII